MAVKRRAAAERAMGALLLASLLTTEGLLLAEGREAEALPLHLCSLSALLALCSALCAQQAALDFLWYVGMPGALLALIFPAPASSRWQALLTASYVTTHALIVLIPLVLMLRGHRPRRGHAPDVLIALQGMALLAFFVNRHLGTDFMFLSAPPAGTPLEALFGLGYLPYLLALEALALSCCAAMGALLCACVGRKERSDPAE